MDKTVYLLYDGKYEDTVLIGVYSSLHKATYNAKFYSYPVIECSEIDTVNNTGQPLYVLYVNPENRKGYLSKRSKQPGLDLDKLAELGKKPILSNVFRNQPLSMAENEYFFTAENDHEAEKIAVEFMLYEFHSKTLILKFADFIANIYSFHS